MQYKVIFSNRAKNEFSTAVEWYDDISLNLSIQFSKEIYDGIKTISLNPNSLPIIRKLFRQYVLQKFPFIIIFSVYTTKKEILIHSIFHTSRNPIKKFKNK